MSATISMSTLLTSSPNIPTLGDLLERLGGVPAERVRYFPLPGTATEQDVIEIEARENRLCELVDGVLVEKTMGYRESYLAILIATLLNNFVQPRKLGAVTGADGMMRLFPGLVRIPDVAYVSANRLPGAKIPTEPIPSLAPDLVVEVVSESNTQREMDRKRGEYFRAGVLLIWLIDHRARSAAVFTDPGKDPLLLDQNGILDGGVVLRGFSLSLRSLFDQLDAQFGT